ncbi:MAG: hypothetical protein JSS91_00745 [Bacteroidetes bacterium]|nr:hypothetical protein [Bacteroidota bacterium]
MEKLIEKFLEIFPGVEREAAEGSVLNILESVRNSQEVAIPEGREEAMAELLTMAKEHIATEASESSATSSEEAEETLTPEASEASE